MKLAIAVIALVFATSAVAQLTPQEKRQLAAEQDCGEVEIKLATQVETFCDSKPKEKFSECMEFGAKKIKELLKQCYRERGAKMPTDSWR